MCKYEEFLSGKGFHFFENRSSDCEMIILNLFKINFDHWTSSVKVFIQMEEVQMSL